MSRRSQVRNQYESQSTGELPAGGFTLTVDSTAGFEIDEPIYLVIEPDVPGQREWVRVISISGNSFNIDPSPNDHGSDGRNLAGSDGDLTHPSGSKVRSVTTEQILLDIFQDTEDDELDLTQHETDGGDPHAQAGYLQLGETDARYVRLDADTTLDPLVNIKTAETSFLDVDLVPKSYVDAQDSSLDAATLASAQAYSDGLDHDHDTPIGVHDVLAAAHGTKANSNAHNHDRYDDGEAVAALATADVYLKLLGDTMGGILNMDGNKIEGVGDGVSGQDAVNFAQMTTKVDTTHGDDVDAHHAKYTDSDAQNAIAVQDIYYTKTEVDSLLAALTLPANRVTPGTFPAGTWQVGAGTWTYLGAVGIAGPFNANSSVDLSGLPTDAGGVDLRIIGNSVRKSA